MQAAPTPFCYAKQKNVSSEHYGEFGYGNVWTWTAIDADTELVPCWLVGGWSTEYAPEFIEDPAGHLTNRVQLTTDGQEPYLEAVEGAFGADSTMPCIKLFGADPSAEKRYSPVECGGTETRRVMDFPDGGGSTHQGVKISQ